MSTATKLPPTDTGRCGERIGYDRHRARREQACRPCTDAMTADHRRRRRAGYQRRARFVRQPPLRLTFGRLVGEHAPHRFTALFPTMGVPLCRDCLGFSDDVRHL